MIRLDSAYTEPGAVADNDPSAEQVPLVRTSTRHGGDGPPLQRSVFSPGLAHLLHLERAAAAQHARRAVRHVNHEIETRMRLEQEVDEMRAILKQSAGALTHEQLKRFALPDA